MEHIKARHAWWGAYFATAPCDTDVPWVCIGRALLRSKCKWWGPLALFDSSQDTQAPIPIHADHLDAHIEVAPPPPLQRMISALQALGTPCDVAALQEEEQQLPQQQQQQQQQLARLRAAVSEWVDARCDIICVQEARLEFAAASRVVAEINAAAAARTAQLRRTDHKGFDYKYCVNAANPHSAGCLILWRRQLVATGDLQIMPEADGDRDAQGRLMLVRFQWCGHTVQLGCVYCPNDSVDRQQFISSTVAAAWQQRPQSSIFMGDWNFCEDPDRDRRSST